MKPFEIAYLCAEPFLPPLYGLVRRRLIELSENGMQEPRILDVGGRKSHYTIGVPGEVTVTDLPRESDIQKSLNLGINAPIIEQTIRRRTNVREVLFDDMTCSRLPDNTFDCVVAVEVLEHVQNVINAFESSGEAIKFQASGTYHLLATAHKSRASSRVNEASSRKQRVCAGACR
jgi:hypothetical protein